MDYAKPLPVIDAFNKPFWDMALQGQVGVQVCSSCNDAHFPGGPVCPKCLSSNQSWRASSGRGTLMSWAKFHRAYWPGFEPDLPFTIALVRLDEGPLLACTLVDFDPAELRLDLAVEATFERVTDEVALARFRPARD